MYVPSVFTLINKTLDYPHEGLLSGSKPAVMDGYHRYRTQYYTTGVILGEINDFGTFQDSPQESY